VYLHIDVESPTAFMPVETLNQDLDVLCVSRDN